VPNYVILTGFVVGGMGRGLAVGCIVTVMGLFFADLPMVHPLITIAVILMTSIVFSLAGFINAVFANSFDDISIIPTFVLTPLIYLGGVFYSIQLLPTFWQVVSGLNPIFYMVNTFRYGILGVSDVDVYWAFLILGVFIVVLYSSCIWLLRHGTGIRH
ncbi:MAG: ABC transporter permease, partial [Pseudohongiellaceae bacterium]